MRRTTLSIRQPYWFLLRVGLAFGLLWSLTGTQSTVFAADSFKVGMVDPQAVIEKSKSGSRALATLKEHAQARENVLKSDQKELERLQEELKSTSSGLSDAEKKRKQEQFGRKYQEFQKRGQEYQAELGQKQKSLVQEYMKKIQVATSAVAKRHKFSLIIDKGSENTLQIVLYSRKGLDITSEVVKEFDRRYK